MIVVRFKMRCKPEKTEQAMAIFREIVAASRALDGVISFDMGRDLSDPDSFIAIEVFEDQAAVERQESLAVVKEILEHVEEIVATPPEENIFHVSSTEP